MYQASKILALSFLLSACASNTERIDENPFTGAPAVQSATWAEQHKQAKLHVLFSGNVNGQLDPCGCAVNPKGGLDRRLNFVRGDKDAAKIIVDAGNALFAARNLDKGQAKAQKERAEAVLQGHAAMGVAAQNVGALDLSAGLEFLLSAAKKNKTPLVSTNIINAKKETVFPTEIWLQPASGQKILVLGLSSADTPLPESLSAMDPTETLQRKLATINAATPIIVLSDLGQKADQELMTKVKRPLLIIGARDLSSLEIPVHEGPSLMVQGQFQGQQWGILDIAWNPEGKGWYNPKLSSVFEQRWKNIQNELAQYKGSADEPEQRERLHQAARRLRAYAPENLGSKTVYDYKLVDLTVEYSKPNELSPLVKKLKQK